VLLPRRSLHRTNAPAGVVRDVHLDAKRCFKDAIEAVVGCCPLVLLQLDKLIKGRAQQLLGRHLSRDIEGERECVEKRADCI